MVNPNQLPWDQRNYKFLRRLRISGVVALTAGVLLIVMAMLGLTGLWATQPSAETVTSPSLPGEERPLADSYWYAIVTLAIGVVGPVLNIVQMLFRRDR